MKARSVDTPATALTIVLPTRNRAHLCGAILRFLRDNGLGHRLIVADSSDVVDEGLRALCVGNIEYRHFDPAQSPEIKLVEVARSVATPYLAQITDDDISFPHAIDACLDYLLHNPDYVVAQGYILGFSVLQGVFDIHSVQWFIPSIAEPTPLRRLYELMRRYQPFFWSVFRTDVYLQAMEAARAEKGVIFKELAFTARVALRGKSARLPLIQTLRGDEKSHSPRTESHPFLWFLHDAQSFCDGYVDYRERLIEFLEGRERRRRIPDWLANLRRARRETRELEQTLDVIHATYLGRELDVEALDATARRLLGDEVPAPAIAPAATAIGETAAGDLVHESAVKGRRYVWRRATVEAGPEVAIEPGERDRVEAALDKYVLN